MNTDHHTLPESLTRYLALPPGSVAEPAPPLVHRGSRRADPRSAHQALESALLRGFVYVIAGLVWLLVLGLVLHHLAR